MDDNLFESNIANLKNGGHMAKLSIFKLVASYKNGELTKEQVNRVVSATQVGLKNTDDGILSGMIKSKLEEMI